jgi:hypothetical protein
MMGNYTFRPKCLARFPLGRPRPSEKKSRQINNLEHVVIGKVVQLCRNMLYLLAGVPNYGKSNFRLSCNIHHQDAMLLATFLRQLRGPNP